MGVSGVRISCFANPAQVTVSTGDVRGANTDGEVLIMIGGTAGQSDWITLYSDDSNFSRGASDKFTIQGVEMGDDRWIKLRLVRDLISHDVLFV